jgi:predicted transcriptional regulator
MSVDETLRIIRKNPQGIWIRELARKAGLSPATICNYLYGYKDSKGRFVKPALTGYVEIKKIGDGAVTIIKPR